MLTGLIFIIISFSILPIWIVIGSSVTSGFLGLHCRDSVILSVWNMDCLLFRKQNQVRDKSGLSTDRVSMRDIIREDILKCLDQKPADFEEMLKFLQAEGYKIKRGKHTAICGKEQKRFIRFRSLGEDFTEDNLIKVIAGEKESPERNEKLPDKKEVKPEKRKFDLVVDIQEKMAQGKNGGYVRWAKKYNVKQFAESILFLQQHDIHDKQTLDALVAESSAQYHALMKTIKDAEEKMETNKAIKTHIINYSKTRETYIAYRKSGIDFSKKCAFATT